MSPATRKRLTAYIDQIIEAERPRLPQHIRSCLDHCRDEHDVENSLRFLKKNCRRWFR